MWPLLTVQIRRAKSEVGAITAEFVMVLPVVLMILGISLGAMELQIERLRMVSIAATVSRALARGEPESKVVDLAQGREFELIDLENYLCVEVSASLSLATLPGLPFLISNRECARKLGL